MPTSSYKKNEDLFIGEDLPKSSQSPWLLSRQLYAPTTTHFKAAKPALLTAIVPKMLFKRKVVTSDQIDSSKTPQKEKVTFLHFVVLRKRIRLRSEKQFASTPDQRAPSLPFLYTLYGGRVKFFRRSSHPKKWATRN